MRRFFLLVLLVLATAVLAKKPGRLTYQGYLSSSTGGTVADGTYPLELKIFNTPAGGSPLWSESQTVTTSNGLFTVVLGLAVDIPDSAMFDSAAYLEITVDTDPPLSPRTRFEDVPFSFVARSVQGEGPIQLNVLNPASGEEGNASMEVDSDASGRVKVKFHWDISDPGSGASSTFVRDFCADSSMTETTHYNAIHRMIRSRKSKTYLDDTEIMSINSASDTASYSRQMSADSGLIENIMTHSATAQATGKRQHRPFRIIKEWGATDGSALTESNSSIDIDSGFTVDHLYTTQNATVEAHENGHAFGHGHLDYLKKVSDPVTGATSERHMWIEADSGIIETQTADNASGLATGKRQHKPLTITKEMDVVRLSGGSAALHEYLDADSGYSESVVASDGGDSVETTMKILPTIKQRSTKAESSSGDAATLGTSLSVDSGYTETAGMTKSDLIAEISQGVNQTREHVLLSRQVGVPGAADEMTLELQTDDSGASTMISRYDGVETAAIESAVTDTAEWLSLTTTTAAAKWDNITLKRGVVGTEIKVSHVGAGANDGVFISSSAAAGGAIGINTSSPILPFQLVGSGCYTGTFGACSDRRYKEDIRPLNNSITTIERLQGVSYDWRRDEYPELKFPNGRQVGLIAQDVEKVLPEVVLTDKTGYKSIDYAKLTPLLIEAVKTQQHQIDAQQKQIDKLEAMLEKFVKNSEASGVTTYGMK